MAVTSQLPLISVSVLPPLWVRSASATSLPQVYLKFTPLTVTERIWIGAASACNPLSPWSIPVEHTNLCVILFHAESKRVRVFPLVWLRGRKRHDECKSLSDVQNRVVGIWVGLAAGISGGLFGGTAEGFCPICNACMAYY